MELAAAATFGLCCGRKPAVKWKNNGAAEPGPHYAPLLRVMGWRSGGTGCHKAHSPRFRRVCGFEGKMVR